jgi:uncharacterized protein (TIGR02594 family)
MNQMKLAYKVAQTQRGVKEIAGIKHNPKIIEYHQACILQANDDETPWCSSFVNWCYIIAGIIINPGMMINLLNDGKNEQKDIDAFVKSATEVNSAILAQKTTSITSAEFLAEKVSLPTRNAMARSWLNFAKPQDTPEIGDIVIFERGNNGYSGHVAFVNAVNLMSIEAIGGNQNDQVSVETFSRFRVLGYRKES